mgnify:CR=1 FL=1
MAIELQTFVEDLPKALTHRRVTPELEKVRNMFWAAFAYSLYKQAHKNYVLRSKGGGKDGVKWEKLKKKTIAYRPRGKSNKGRGLLTKAEDKEWKKIFVIYFKKLMPTMGEVEAKIRAGKIAWSVMKKKGAKTKLQVYGNKNVPIMVRSGRLRDSLKPGEYSSGTYIPSGPDQIFEVTSGKLSFGSSVPYAAMQNENRPIFGNEDAIVEIALEEALEVFVKELKRMDITVTHRMIEL